MVIHPTQHWEFTFYPSYRSTGVRLYVTLSVIRKQEYKLRWRYLGPDRKSSVHPGKRTVTYDGLTWSCEKWVVTTVYRRVQLVGKEDLTE